MPERDPPNRHNSRVGGRSPLAAHVSQHVPHIFSQGLSPDSAWTWDAPRLRGIGLVIRSAGASPLTDSFSGWIMPVLERIKARLRGHRRVACRTDQGFRTVITAVPLANGKGVRLDTGLGGFVLTRLEAGHLRGELRDAVLASAELSTEDGER